ncbi:MAG TPA: MlaD family protein [Thermoleophilaceae bacterium]|nr:MlaD family protein [Thermoleophilaceae bacterium]
MSPRVVPLVALTLVALTVTAVVLREEERRLRVALPSASNLVAGLQVRLAGVEVGSIESVRADDGVALVGLRVEDESVWPLPRGTAARLRFGTTVGDAVRYVELLPGPGGAPPLPDNALLSGDRARAPVEFDEFFQTFDAPARADFQGWMRESAATFRSRQRMLARTLRTTPRALFAVADLWREFSSDPAALRELVRETGAVTRTLRARRPQVQRLIEGADATFGEMAARNRDIERSLDALPGALRETRDTLGRSERSISALRAFVRDLSPGAAALPRLARATDSVLHRLRAMEPDARRALETGAAAAPEITSLLRNGRPFAERSAGALEGLVAPLGCIRPYGPEIAGFFGTWTGWSKNHDRLDHIGRIRVTASPTSWNGNQMSSAEYLALVPGVEMALPRPPGLAANQPWYVDECGATERSTDPRYDPETLPAEGGPGAAP